MHIATSGVLTFFYNLTTLITIFRLFYLYISLDLTKNEQGIKEHVQNFKNVAHLTSYCFVASPFETKLTHELVLSLVVC